MQECKLLLGRPDLALVRLQRSSTILHELLDATLLQRLSEPYKSLDQRTVVRNERLDAECVVSSASGECDDSGVLGVASLVL